MIKSQRSTNTENYCNKAQAIEAHQSVVSKEMRRLNALIVYHSTGSGKTCAALQIAKQFLQTREIIFVMPRAIIANFANEMQSFCGFDKTPSVHVYTYMGFVKRFKYNSAKSYLIVVDEVHNLLSSGGMLYNAIMDRFDRIDNLKIVLMTATPVIDDIDQLRLLTNMITKKEDRLSKHEYMQKYYSSAKLNSKFGQVYGKHISYYPGAPASAYPKLYIHYVNVKLHDRQINAIEKDKTYRTLKNNVSEGNKFKSVMATFYIKLRLYSNIYIPVSLHDSIEKGYCSKITDMYSNFDLNHKIFVYTSFTNKYGIEAVVAYLEHQKKWKYYFNCTHSELNDKNIFKYIIWAGGISEKNKKRSLEVFNSRDNLYGEKIKLVIGSPASKEGISFEAVTQVHILEPYWNWSRIYQIYSRAVRFCRHEKLKPKERTVHTYIYIGVGGKDFVSVDNYILDILREKQKLITNTEAGLQKYSLDYLLYRQR